MDIVKVALKEGDACHIRLNDGQTITDVIYVGDVDNAGRKYQMFSSKYKQHVVNPSYVASITKIPQGVQYDPQRTERTTATHSSTQ